MIKDRLCVRKHLNAKNGRKTWVFDSATSYTRAMDILELEPGRCRFR